MYTLQEVILYITLTILFLRRSDIPTVHISLPEKVYEELKSLAGSMGIQITDLIKMFIKQGLYGNINADAPALQKLKTYEDELTYVKGKLYLLESLLNETVSRLEDLEKRLEELESPDVLIKARRSNSGRLNKP